MKNVNTSKIALNSHNNDRILSPTETIREMWEYTDENGELIIPAWPRDDDEKPTYFRCAMTWSREDAERLASECETLVDTLKNYATDLDGIYTANDFEKLLEEKKNALRAVWKNYFGDCADDGKDASHTAMMRARRICRVCTMGAPKLLLDNEAFFLAQAMAVHAFCRAHDEVNEAGQPIQTESNQQ